MFSSDKWFGASPSFYNGVATQSLRMDYASGTYLSRTPSSTGDRKTWTWSGWIKRTDVTSFNQYIYTAHSGSNYFAFYFKEGKLASYYGTGSNYGTISDREFRDTTAWYHIVHQVDAVNTTQRVWVNGSEMSLNSSRNPGNSNYPMNESSVPMVIGKHSWGTSYFNDMYLAEVNYTDGQKYEASDFGETKNGVWIAKEPSVTYGTNGYRLQFKQTGDGETTASSTTIGADTSDNNNHYKDYNLDSYDSNMPDSPENNFCTLNPLNANDNRGQATFSRGNLRMVSSSSNRGFTTGTMKLHGKVYFEVLSRDGNNGFVGINDINNEVHSGKGQSLDFYNGIPRIDGTALSDTGTFSDGDIMGVAVDVDAKSIQFFRNNSSVHSATYTTDAEYFPFLYDSSGGRTMDAVANFGQDSSFTGEKTSGSSNAQDANGHGDFFYAPPSGFLALCSANLPDTTISPNSSNGTADEFFNTVLWTGNATDTNITGVGFQPDWVWAKNRSNAYHHALVDSSRGATKVLKSSDTTSEGTFTEQITGFLADGFSVGDNSDSGNYVNINSHTYVAWNWKANGGTTSSNTDGTITSTVQANTTSGFSIVTYTGTGTAGTIGHSLGKVPDAIFVWNRTDISEKPMTFPNIIGADKYLYIHATNASASYSGFFNDTNPTTSVFSVGTDNRTNGSGDSFVAYCFAEIEGYSKFGSYVGNSDSDGSFVFTGFRPAWVMIKSTSSGSWCIFDNKMNPDNAVNLMLLADSSGNENAGGTSDNLDFLSNGFKLRDTSGGRNTSGTTYIYMAFSDGQTAKFSNAR